MRLKLKNLRQWMIGLVAAQAAGLFLLQSFFHANIFFALVILVIEAVMLFFAFERFNVFSDEQSKGVKNALGSAAKEAYLTGEVGMIIYDDNYIITWMSDLFAERDIDKLGMKVLTWIPEADDLISGKADTSVCKVEDRIYQIKRKEDAPLIIFRDITETTTYKEKYTDEHVVVGMASYDNYDESINYVDEADAANINAAIRTPLIDYCNEYGILYKRLSNNRYLLVLNEKIFSKLMDDHFSILNKVRKSAQKLDVSITLSMAFARGAADFEEMDEMVAKLMDLAQTRGGDQVAVQAEGEEVKYFGGSSEATEKRSRVRVRVMSHALRDLIQKSSNVIICGHKTADFDCIGSAICLSRMVSALHKNVCIIAKTGGIEEKLDAAMKANMKELKEEVNFVTESEAINQLQENSLVIMTDHHNVKQSNGAGVLERAKKVVIIDHHRRSTEMGVKPVLVYIEAGASSTCELLTEMIPYVSQRIDISPLAATIMLAGIIVDTQKYRVRTGARTYDAASQLRQMGADPLTANDYLKDTFDEYSLKSKVISESERYKNGVIIASVKDKQLTRSLMSQVADILLGIQNVQAAFVIANTSDVETGISARSNGTINVQLIMEEMKGGGHMTAAAMQRKNTNVEAVRKELIETIDDYFKEEKNESHS